MKIGGIAYNPYEVNYNYSTERISCKLKFITRLPEGEIQLKFNSSSLVDWAFDTYPSELKAETIVQIPPAGTPTAIYSQGSEQLILSFAEGYQFDYPSLAAGYVLKVDGVEYALRGYIASRDWENKNKMFILLNGKYSWKFKQAVEQGTDVQIKYAKVNGENDQQMADTAGALLPNFDYVPVIKQP